MPFNQQAYAIWDFGLGGFGIGWIWGLGLGKSGILDWVDLFLHYHRIFPE